MRLCVFVDLFEASLSLSSLKQINVTHMTQMSH